MNAPQRAAASVSRIATIAFGTYREAVRARVLLGIFGLGLATVVYSLFVAALSLHNEERVVSDLGAASLSLYGVAIATVLGSTSLYREVEYKTVFPILSRPIRRWEYLVGKYLGTVLTVAVFIAAQSGAVLMLLALEAGEAGWRLAAAAAIVTAALLVPLLRFPRAGVHLLVPWSIALAIAGWLLGFGAASERQLVIASAVLAVLEVGIVAALATLFASFSSPFLTAAFTVMIFVIGRSADTLAHLPSKLYGRELTVAGRSLARVAPNLHAFVPARSLLLGQTSGQTVWSYVAVAAAYAVAYATVLLVIGAMAFRRRDFS